MRKSYAELIFPLPFHLLAHPTVTTVQLLLVYQLLLPFDVAVAV